MPILSSAALLQGVGKHYRLPEVLDAVCSFRHPRGDPVTTALVPAGSGIHGWYQVLRRPAVPPCGPRVTRPNGAQSTTGISEAGAHESPFSRRHAASGNHTAPFLFNEILHLFCHRVTDPWQQSLDKIGQKLVLHKYLAEIRDITFNALCKPILGFL